jgi:hypothetical protein
MARQMITIYVGDVTHYLAKIAIKSDPLSTLLTEHMINDIPPGTYYTSLGDLGGLVNFQKMFMQADYIIYAPPPTESKWSDARQGKSAMKKCTEDFLKVFKHHGKLVENFHGPRPVLEKKSTILELKDIRKTSNTQLWISGCSISHGVGVQPEQRYGQLLSSRLNLPVSFLTRSGSSVIWAADQILRSDFKENDILVWGLTSVPRLPVFLNNRLNHLCPNDDLFKPYVKWEEDILYRSLTSVYQVINFCQKIKIDLFLVNLIDNEFLDYLIDDLEVLWLHHRLCSDTLENLYEDLGSDGLHPGVKSHEFYATEIFKKIKGTAK